MSSNGHESVVTGLAFAEGPRWNAHTGELFFSDMHAQQVMATTPDGVVRRVCEVPNDPSGLGWLPDGRLLVVSMTDRKVLVMAEDGSMSEYADLYDLAPFHCNDMVVAESGRAYVGNFGFDLHGGGRPCRTVLIAVEPDGAPRVVADDLGFPNGMVITPDGTTLVVGESYSGCLTAFRIADDGSLQDRRVFAQLDGAVPDGICLDAEGAIWIACPLSNRVLRVREGGEVTDEHRFDCGAFACMLGGADRRTLFVCIAATSDPEVSARDRTGAIVAIPVDDPGAGLP